MMSDYAIMLKSTFPSPLGSQTLKVSIAQHSNSPTSHNRGENSTTYIPQCQLHNIYSICTSNLHSHWQCIFTTLYNLSDCHCGASTPPKPLRGLSIPLHWPMFTWLQYTTPQKYKQMKIKVKQDVGMPPKVRKQGCNIHPPSNGESFPQHSYIYIYIQYTFLKISTWTGVIN